ncbi:MAG: hypothetical protein AYP45_00700 [Candidatus Brocadia carolinensis]|uniref:Uncharacterized protein n=1 Tax=Candidatus Brocadia carolinensis TaxID=1004156 RepID=A0A1V4AXK5_9BACT|nr:MAG: hypothetical protein AYP45_00700 [Candidatus Brocadia caroliniensis]
MLNWGEYAGGVVNIELKVVEKSGTIQFDGTEYFEHISLSHSHYFWLRTNSCPCSIEDWVLAEARFVFEEYEAAPSSLAFFNIRVLVANPSGLMCFVSLGQFFLDSEQKI